MHWNNFLKKQNRILKVSAAASAAPYTEPLDLAEIKSWLIISHNLHDQLLTRLIKAVRGVCENRMKRHLIPVTITVIAEVCEPFNMPRTPVQSISSLKKLNTDHAYEAFTSYTWSAENNILYITEPGTYQIVFEAGYANPVDIPQEIKQAMLSEIAYRYSNRDDNQVVLSNRISATAEAYLVPFINMHYI